MKSDTDLTLGKYRDRRALSTSNAINCTKTIWILATNAFDPTIQSFCDSHQEDLLGSAGTKEHDEKVQKLARQLSARLQKESIGVLGVSSIPMPSLIHYPATSSPSPHL
jgi:hypothetical protein